MRKFLSLLFSCLFFFACNNEKTQSAVETTATPEEVPVETIARQESVPIVADPNEKLLGSYVGPFGRNKITFLITKIAGDSVVGRTIVGGNDRPFYGTFKKDGSFYFFNGKEPGDHKDDGVFDFVIDENELDILYGGWKPYAKGRPEKEYNLQRKKFQYRTDVGDYPQASQRLLKPEDVENEMKEDLEFMRNEIFARHGFCFNKRHLRQQFEMQEWYVPNTVDIKGFLTEIEKKNIAMIKRYEKYADEYGDEYGR